MRNPNRENPLNNSIDYKRNFDGEKKKIVTTYSYVKVITNKHNILDMLYFYGFYNIKMALTIT